MNGKLWLLEHIHQNEKNPYIKNLRNYIHLIIQIINFLNMEYFTFPYPETNHGLFFSKNLVKLIGDPRKPDSKLSKKTIV